MAHPTTPEPESAPSLSDADAATIVARCNALMRRLVLGEPSAASGSEIVPGLRRRRPLDVGTGDPKYDGELVSEAPLPAQELGFEVSVAKGSGSVPAIVVDVISLELARAIVVAPDRIRIEVVYCDDYPGHMLAGFGVPDGHRAVTLPSDSRRALWTNQLLALVYADLGERALAFEFELETISAAYEDLQESGLVFST